MTDITRMVASVPRGEGLAAPPKPCRPFDTAAPSTASPLFIQPGAYPSLVEHRLGGRQKSPRSGRGGRSLGKCSPTPFTSSAPPAPVTARLNPDALEQTGRKPRLFDRSRSPGPRPPARPQRSEAGAEPAARRMGRRAAMPTRAAISVPPTSGVAIASAVAASRTVGSYSGATTIAPANAARPP